MLPATPCGYCRRVLAVALLATSASLALFGSREVSGNPRAAMDPTPTGILVAFKQTVSQPVRLNALSHVGLMPDRKVQSPFFARAVLTPQARAAGVDPKAVLRLLQRDPAIRVAEWDGVVHALATPNDPRYSELWGLHNLGQSGGTADADIDAPEAWDRSQGSDSIIVAVIDTGVDYNHPDLAANILRNASNQVVGYDYANDDTDPMDDHDHGTHCAGTIGGRGNNRVGVVGVNWRVKIMPVKFLDGSGSGFLSAAIQATDFARSHGARVMSNSWGGGGYSQLMLEAIQRARAAGILYVVAAGNDAANTDVDPSYPSSYGAYVDNVISVGASDWNDQQASFSNFGQTSVDLFAPGVNIVSTTPNNTYASFSGTSMATPHVAGAAALVLSRFPSLTYAQIKARLRGGVDHPSAFNDLCSTGGRLNVNQALEDDSTSPGAPTNFRITHRAWAGALLVWTASGDDGPSGTASSMEVRYSTQPITAANFVSATLGVGGLAPLPSGSTQTFLLAGLDPNTSYYFALRAIDNVGNVSPIATAGPITTLAVNCPLDDNVEGVLCFSGQSPWGTTSAQNTSSTHSYTDSPNGSYVDNTDISLTETAPVPINGDASLTFKAKYALEPGFDFLYTEVSADNGVTWQRQGLVLNGTADWTYYSVPLVGFQGRSIRVRFRLISDSSYTDDGVYLDDIKICISPSVCVFEETAEGALQLSGESPWAVTTESSFSPNHSYADSPGSTYGNDIDLSLSTNVSPALINMIPTLTFSARTELERGYDGLFVEASSNGGSTWQRLPLSLTGTSDWRTYSVPLVQYLGQNVKLRFRLITDDSVTYDGVWIDDVRICGLILEPIGSTPVWTVTVSAPNGGETWIPGSSQEVTWRSQNVVGDVKLELSTNGGTTYTPLVTTTPNDGSQSVIVPNTPSTQCRVRVSAVNDATCQDASNANFAIVYLGGTLSVPGNVNFGTVRVGHSVTKKVTIANTNRSTNLVVTVGSPGAPFQMVSGGGTSTLSPRGKLMVQVRCVPTVKGPLAGTLPIASSDSSRSTAGVALKGQGK